MTLTAAEVLRVREVEPEPNEFLPVTDRARRWFEVQDSNGRESLVLSGGLFIQGALYCDRHQLPDLCECTARVRRRRPPREGFTIPDHNPPPQGVTL